MSTISRSSYLHGVCDIIYSVVKFTSSCQSSHLHCVYIMCTCISYAENYISIFLFNIYSLQVIVALMAVCLLCCTDFD